MVISSEEVPQQLKKIKAATNRQPVDHNTRSMVTRKQVLKKWKRRNEQRK